MKHFCLLIFLLTFSLLWGDALTVDPPKIWVTDCVCCGPIEPCCFYEDHLVCDLRNPVLIEGVLSTDEGGVLIAPGLRIQARSILYTRREGEHSVHCEGDLLIDYQRHTVTGASLDFDFLTGTGRLVCGKTAAPPWYVGGDEIFLCPNGDLIVLGGYVTTSECGERSVQMTGSKIIITRDQLLTVVNLKFQVKQVPILWFPRLALDLHNYGHSPFAFEFGWGGFLGTHAGIRYQFLSWKELKGYARLDGYLGRGLGGGIETAYNPACSPVEWYTRNYYAHDLSIFDRDKRDRYRFQGRYYNSFFRDTTSASLTYDVVSDAQFAADYQMDAFNLTPAERTELTLHHQNPSFLANLYARVRVNSFQTINQELPSFYFQWHPFELWDSGILAENVVRAGYLDYTFADQIMGARNFSAGRFEVRPRLYRPFPIGPCTITPAAGFVGIAYSDTRMGGGAAGQAVGTLDVEAKTSLSRCYFASKHVVEPYLHYTFLTSPRVPIDRAPIFTIEDAYDLYSVARFGVRNSLFTQNACGVTRSFWVDLWTNAFLFQGEVKQTIQKGYLDCEWIPTRRLLVGAHGAWNFQEKQLDFANGRIEWTLSDRLALSAEYRYDSPFSWRKADFYNFLLETVRPQALLLATPLSERRHTVLAHLFYRPNPDWTIEGQIRQGKNDKGFKPRYLEYEVAVSTIIFEHYRLLVKCEKFESDKPRFSVSLKLNPGPPRAQVRKRC